MKRTYLIFQNRSEREKALDFLTKTTIKYTCNVVKGDKPCWLSMSPKTLLKTGADLYLSGLYINSFSTFTSKPTN